MVSSTVRHQRASISAATRSAPRNSAFTLVELLVVIGIIAVLIGILLPALGRARAHANQLKCMANLRSLGQAMYLYAGDNKGSLPWGFCFKGNSNPENEVWTGDSIDWTTLLMKIMARKSGVYDAQDNVGTANPGLRATFMCPEVYRTVTTESLVTHYSVHPRLMPDWTQLDWPALAATGKRVGLKPYKLAKIKRSQEIAAIFEGPVNNGEYGAWSVAFAIDRKAVQGSQTFMTDNWAFNANINGGQPVDMTPALPGWTNADVNSDSQKNPGNIRFRHVGDSQTNCLMVDGHVQSFNFNKRFSDPKNATDLLRKNVCVNP